MGVVALTSISGTLAAAQPEIKPADASAPQKAEAKAGHVKIEAVAGRIAPGETNLIGLTFTIEKEWHIYWDGLNDSGSAPIFKVNLPDGWTQGKTKWPVPRRQLLAGDIVDYVYDNEVTLLIPIDVPSSAAGQHELKFDVRWLVCSDVCIPEKGTTSLAVTVNKPDAAPVDAAKAPSKITETLAKRMPKPMKEAKGVSVRIEDGTLRIEAKDATAIRFMPATSSVAMLSAATEGEVSGPLLVAAIADPDEEHRDVVGVIQVDRAKGTESFWFDGSVDSKVVGVAPDKKE